MSQLSDSVGPRSQIELPSPSIPMSSAQSLPWTLELIKQHLNSPDTRHIRSDSRRSIAELSNGLFVKYGKSVHVGEGVATRIVSKQTSLPVPQIICMFFDSKCTYIVETKLEGLRLGEALSQMDKQAQIDVAKEILSITRCLSEITPHDEQAALEAYLQQPDAVRLPEIGEKISLLASPGIRGGLIGRSTYSIGIFSPFYNHKVCSAKSTAEFVDWWADMCGTGRAGRKLASQNVAKIDSSRPLLFSHGNLDVENILVAKYPNPDTTGTSWKVTGVIDWEAAGWYPYFFDEWHTIRRSPHYRESGWVDALEEIGVPSAQVNLTPEQVAQQDASAAIAFDRIFQYADHCWN